MSTSVLRFDARETSQRLAERFDARRKNPTAIPGMPYGYKALDAMTGGIQSEPTNSYTILFSRQGVGKTALAAEIAKNRGIDFRDTKSGKVARCALLEGGRDLFQTRMACIVSNVPHRALKTGRINDAQWDAFYKALMAIARLPIEYLDTESGTITLETIESFVRQDDTGWWMLDHIGMIPGARQGTNQLSDISKELLRLCKVSAPGLILTHQNRTASGKDGEKDQRPTMENIAGADFISRDADVVLGLYRPDKDKSAGTQSNEKTQVKPGELLVLKNREGEEGTIHMSYHSWYTRWEENDPLNAYWLSLLE